MKIFFNVALFLLFTVLNAFVVGVETPLVLLTAPLSGAAFGAFVQRNESPKLVVQTAVAFAVIKFAFYALLFAFA